MTTFQEAFAREFTDPDGWDVAAAGAATFEEFFKDLAKRQALAAQGLITTAAAAADYAKSYETSYNAVVRANGQFAAQYSSLGAEDRRLFDYWRTQEANLKVVVTNLKAAATSGLEGAALKQAIAKSAPIAGRSLGYIVGGAQILTAAATETSDEVAKLTAGVLAGAAAGYGGAIAGTTIALALVGGGPLVWVTAAALAVIAGYAGSNGAEAAWATWISPDANRKVREMIKQVEQMYGEDHPTTLQVKEQLRLGAERLGSLNGTWMVGYSELTGQQKAELTALIIGTGGGAGNEHVVADLQALFEPSWGAQRLDLRDSVISVLAGIARDSTLSYAQRRVSVNGSVLDVEVPTELASASNVLRNVVLTSVDTLSQPFIGNVAVDRIRIALAPSTLAGSAGDDLLIGSDANDTLTGDAGFDYLIGGGGADLLAGGASVDVLVGSDGDDTLIGGTGGDYLLGGVGADRYEFAAGHGGDVIVDADGVGTLWFEGQQITGGKAVGRDSWISDDRQFGFARVPNGSPGSYDLIISRGSQLDQTRTATGSLGRWGCRCRPNWPTRPNHGSSMARTSSRRYATMIPRVTNSTAKATMCPTRTVSLGRSRI